MANVVFELSGDEQKLVTSLIRAKRAMDDLEKSTENASKAAAEADAKLQKVADETVKHAKGFNTAMESSTRTSAGLASSVTGIAAGFLTVQKAVEVAAEVMETRLQRVKTLADNIKNSTQGAMAGLAGGGSYELMPQVRQQMMDLSKKYDMDVGKLGSTFQALSSSGIPASHEVLMETMDQAARLGKTGLDAAGVGRTMLIARDTMGMGAEDAADFASQTAKYFPQGMGESERKLMGMAAQAKMPRGELLKLLAARASMPAETGAIDEMLQTVIGGGPTDAEMQASMVEVAPEAATKRRGEIASKREQLRAKMEALDAEREQKKRAWQDEDLERAQSEAGGGASGKYASAHASARKAEQVEERRKRMLEERSMDDRRAALRAEEEKLSKEDANLAKEKILAPTDESWRLAKLKDALDSGTIGERLQRIARDPSLMGKKGEKLSTQRFLSQLTGGADIGPTADEREASYYEAVRADPAMRVMHDTEAIRAEQSRQTSTTGLYDENFAERRKLQGMKRRGVLGLLNDTGDALGVGKIRDVTDARVAHLLADKDDAANAQKVTIVNDQRAAPARESGGAAQQR